MYFPPLALISAEWKTTAALILMRVWMRNGKPSRCVTGSELTRTVHSLMPQELHINLIGSLDKWFQKRFSMSEFASHIACSIRCAVMSQLGHLRAVAQPGPPSAALFRPVKLA